MTNLLTLKRPSLNNLSYLVFVLFLLSTTSLKAQERRDQQLTGLTYEVQRLKKPMNIDGNWEKSQWKKIKPLVIDKFMGKVPGFKPVTEAKVMYDDEFVYVIFRVKDRYVSSLVQEFNGIVSGDACVEFFFAPDASLPDRYFNLEVNAGGTPLFYYVTKPWVGFNALSNDEIKQVKIAHSLPEKIDPEITEPVTWTIEYSIPIALLKKFSNVTQPKKGTVWRANFYKTASRSSNPHWITWSFVDKPKPDFHLPQFFGSLTFN
jgi:hypothetical protein